MCVDTLRPQLYMPDGDDAYPPEEGEAAPQEEFVEEEVKQVSIPAPDPALPPSFDSETPVHHFRFLESASQVRVDALSLPPCLQLCDSSCAAPRCSGWCAPWWSPTAGTTRRASRASRWRRGLW